MHLGKKQGTDVWYAEITDVKQCGEVRKNRKTENSKSRKIGPISKGLSKTQVEDEINDPTLLTRNTLPYL